MVGFQLEPARGVFRVGPQNRFGCFQNGGTPKGMVYNGKPYKMDDLGVPLFLETPIWF